jgi:hypothetical protein
LRVRPVCPFPLRHSDYELWNGERDVPVALSGVTQDETIPFAIEILTGIGNLIRGTAAK